jgi:hypothetical protein
MMVRKVAYASGPASAQPNRGVGNEKGMGNCTGKEIHATSCKCVPFGQEVATSMLGLRTS